MTIEIVINGVIYEDLKELKVTKSLGALAGSFEFSTAVEDLTGVPIKEYDSVIVKVDGHRVIYGYIDPLRTRYDINSHALVFGGYDTTVDLIHCSVQKNTVYKGPMSFKYFVERVLSNNGFKGESFLSTFDIDSLTFEEFAERNANRNQPKNSNFQVIDKTNSLIYDPAIFSIKRKPGEKKINLKELSGTESYFFEGETATAKAGDSIFDFLNKYAQLKGVVLNSDGKGNLVIYNNRGILSTVILTNRAGQRDNEVIISGETTYDMKDRFSKIIVKSQGGTGGFGEFSAQEKGGENIEGFAEDLDVKRKRVKVIVAKSATDAKGCKTQAIWEVNKRRAASVKYTCKVQGHSSPNGELWQAGTKFPVIDTYADINSVMMLNSVIYNESLSGGTSTNLTFVAQDVYSLQSEDPTKNINKVGENR